MTLQVVQATLLIAVYEIGHAIFPAAYLTTGQSVRLGHVLGLHDRQSYPQVLKRMGAWAEIEEARRTWWGCMLLDRCVHPSFIAMETDDQQDMSFWASMDVL